MLAVSQDWLLATEHPLQPLHLASSSPPHTPSDTLPQCEQMIESSDREVRCAGAKVLSLLLRGKLHQESHVGVKEFFALHGLGALQRSLFLETADRQVEMGGLWLQERGGARVYVEELLSELPCAPCSS